MNEADDMVPALQGADDLLLPYQKEALAEMRSTELFVLGKSRRIGNTWGPMALDAVLTASAAPGEGGDDYSYFCYDKEITREFIDACAMWAKVFNLAAGEIDDAHVFEDIDENGETREIKAFRIDFASGYKIVALPSVPRAVRGRKGVVGIDEAAFIKNLKDFLKSALALLVWGGRVAVCSSHNGLDNPFNELLEDVKSGRREGKWKTITFADALAAGLYERVCKVHGDTPTPAGKFEFERKIRAIYGEDAAEELDCVPSTGAGAYISADLVIAAQHEDAGKPDLYGKQLCFGGRDIARRRDLAVMWVFELVGNVLWLRERREMAKTKFTEQDAIFDGQMKRYRVVRYGVDQSGMGEPVVEGLIDKYGDVVEGVLFTPPNRLAMASAMKKRFEDGTIRIADDPLIRSDFRAIKKTKGAGDTIRLVNDTEEVHADMFWACALACLVAATDPPAYRGYQSAPKPTGFDVPDTIAGDRIFRMRARDAAPRRAGRFGDI